MDCTWGRGQGGHSACPQRWDVYVEEAGQKEGRRKGVGGWKWKERWGKGKGYWVSEGLFVIGNKVAKIDNDNV